MTNIKVFDKNWFKKYNKAITWLARLPFVGEWIFRIKKYGFELDINKIIEVTPNSVVEDLGYILTNKGLEKQYKQHFFVRNEFALRLQNVFYPIWITFHIWDIITRPIPQLNLGFDTLTEYPAAGANSPVDGAIRTSGSNRTFAQIISDAGTTAFPTDVSVFCSKIEAGTSTDKFAQNYRSIFLFDTDAISSEATISGATFSVWGSAKSNQLGEDSIHVVASTPAANNNLATSDYGQLGSTSFGSLSYGAYNGSDAVYNTFTLNASGIAAIAKGTSAITKLGIRGGWDLAGTFGGTWGSEKYTYFLTVFADSSTHKPKLVVTYATVTSPTVTTQAASSVTTTSMTGNGNITATGGANCTRRGFCYKVGTSGDPTVSDSTAYDDGTFGTGAYTKGITSLTANTGYRVRAYAVNSAGTSYGSTVQETTLAAGPANVKTYKGLVAASVKTCKGLAIASVKSKKGLA